MKQSNTYKKALFLLIFYLICSSATIHVYAENDFENPKIIVSLGDSYSSGEGIEPFYGQEKELSEKVKDENWLAHRSKKSWASFLTLPENNGTMSDNWNKYWFFRASSGAETTHLKNKQTKEYSKNKLKGEVALAAQLTIFDELKDNSVDYVTITIGGNDVGFVDIIKECVIQGIPFTNKNRLNDKFQKTWEDFYTEGGTRDDILSAYKSIKEKAGAQAHIVVVGYPPLLSKKKNGKNGTGMFFSADEANQVNDNVTRFNSAIENIVESCQKEGMKISFVSVENKFVGHEAYSGKPYINSIILTPQEQDLTSKPISAYSMHPNLEGAKIYASCVQSEIDKIERLATLEEKIENKIDETSTQAKQKVAQWVKNEWQNIWESLKDRLIKWLNLIFEKHN